MTRSFSFSNVISVIALFVALGGVGYAALVGSDGVVHACAKKTNGAARIVKAGKKCKASESVLTWNQKGQQGDKGAKGDDGAKGATGAAGTAGAAGAPGVAGTPGTNGTNGMGLTSGATFFQGGSARFAAPSGETSAQPSEAFMQVLTPNHAITISELAAKTDISPGAAVSIQFSLDGAPSGPICTMSTAATLCAPSGTLSVPAHSLLSIKITGGTGGTNPNIAFSYTIT